MIVAAIRLSAEDSCYPGYVITRRFQLWVGSGVDGDMRVYYDLQPDQWMFHLVPGEVKPGTQARLVCSQPSGSVMVDGVSVPTETFGRLPLPCEVLIRDFCRAP